jgi:hypothetical protein
VTSLQFAVAQEPAQGSTSSPRGDRGRAAEVRTASGERVTLAVVAEDGSSGAAADWVLGQVFSSVKGTRRGKHVGEVLRHTLDAAVKTLQAESPGIRPLSCTAAAVWRGSLYVSHTGRSAGFLVQGQEVKPLTGLGGPRHGDPRTPWVESTAMAGRPLGRGDRVVLISDGLLKTSPEDGRPFLDPKAMPEYVSGVSPLQAARHLVSIALGRDAPDDLSVVVVAAAGAARVKRERRGLRRWALALAAIVLLAVIAAAWGLRDLLPGTTSAISDYGYAVLIEGELQAEGQTEDVQRLEPLPAQLTLTAQQDSSLRFQSTFAGGSDITAAAMYLRSGTRVQLAALDRRSADSQSAEFPTQVDLLLGEILLLRETGARDLRVGALGGYAGLVGPGKAALGVGLDVGGVEIVCLVGTCMFQPASGELALLFAGQRLRPDEGSPQIYDSGVHQEWNRLCGGCLSTP